MENTTNEELFGWSMSAASNGTLSGTILSNSFWSSPERLEVIEHGEFYDNDGETNCDLTDIGECVTNHFGYL